MPELGAVDEIARNLIVGWAVDTSSPGKPLDIEVFVNGNLLEKRVADKPRPNVRKRLESLIPEDQRIETMVNCGFEFALDPPLSVFHEHDLEVRIAGSGKLIGRGRKVLPGPPSNNHTALTPIVLVAAGRSGTTLLMQLLGQHPEIVIADRYAYEIKFLSYYSQAYRVLVSDADRKRSYNPKSLVQDTPTIGYNPYNGRRIHQFVKTPGLMDEHFDKDVPEIFAQTFGSLLMSYYGKLQQDQGKTNARYFAEKGSASETLRYSARIFCGQSRELLLVRDPRDIACSAHSFWKMPRSDAIRNIGRIMGRLEVIYKENSSDRMLIRYEDLVADTPAVMGRVHTFLGVEPNTAMSGPAQGSSQFDRHGTSSSPGASIGRWRRELDADEIALCEKSFGSFLDCFDYAR